MWLSFPGSNGCQTYAFVLLLSVWQRLAKCKNVCLCSPQLRSQCFVISGSVQSGEPDELEGLTSFTAGLWYSASCDGWECSALCKLLSLCSLYWTEHKLTLFLTQTLWLWLAYLLCKIVVLLVSIGKNTCNYSKKLIKEGFKFVSSRKLKFNN